MNWAKDQMIEEEEDRRAGRKPGVVGGVVETSTVGPLHDLAPNHRRQLEASGLSPASIQGGGFATTYSYKVPGRSGRICQALIIPYRHPVTGDTGYVRARPDNPRVDRDGKEVKYEAPKGQDPRAYFPFGFPAEALTDPSVPLLLTEGEKKSAKAQQEGFNTIGISGVWSWQKKRPRKDGRAYGPRKLIDDLANMAWERQVFLVFDSDAADNGNVQLAERRLAEHLTEFGARVKIVRLPPGPNDEKVGLDDFLVERGEEGPAALRELLEKAQPPAEAEQILTGRELYDVFIEETLAHLSEREALVWFVLFKYARADTVSIAQTKIAERIGWTRVTVTKAITDLRKKGLVVRPDHLRGDNVRKKSSVYFLRGRIPKANSQ